MARRGISLVETLIAIVVLSLVLLFFSRGSRFLFKGIRQVEIKTEIQDLRQYISGQIDCAQSIAPGGVTVAACLPANSGQLLKVLDKKAQTLVSNVDPPTLYGNVYVLRAKCPSGKILIEFARLKGPVQKSADVKTSTLADQPLLDKKYDWEDLYHGIPTPCDASSGGPTTWDDDEESSTSCVAVACSKAGANCNTFLEYQTVGGTSMNRGLGGIIYACKNVRSSCVEAACSMAGANCNTYLEFQTVGGTSMNRGLGGVLAFCKDVRGSCVAAACAKPGANCSTFLEYQTVGGTSMNRGLGGILYGCQRVRGNCIETSCAKAGANCSTFLEYQTVGGTSMNRALGGVLYGCQNVHETCVETSCAKAGANCGTFLEFQIVGGTSMNRGLAGVLNFCQAVP